MEPSKTNRLFIDRVFELIIGTDPPILSQPFTTVLFAIGSSTKPLFGTPVHGKASMTPFWQTLSMITLLREHTPRIPDR